jgi:hypothetical protein
VEVRAVALGDAPGRAALSIPVVNGAADLQWASTAKDYAAYPHVAVERITVEVVRLDDLGLTDVTAMKLDAEGAEYAVLRGARATLARCRPVLTMELESATRRGCTWAVPAFLDGWIRDGLRACGRVVADGGAARPTMQHASTDPSVFAASDPYVFNFYAWPPERDAEAMRCCGR